MIIKIEPITRRKTVLVKELYQQGEKQSEMQYSTSNRIMSVIGFDLGSETHLKAIVCVLDQQKPPAESFPAANGAVRCFISMAKSPYVTLSSTYLTCALD